MHQIILTNLKKKKKWMKRFLPFFENYDRALWTLGIGIAKTGLRIRPRRPRIKLYANFGKSGCIIPLKNSHLARIF